MNTNVTVSLDAALLREVKVLAAKSGTSISALLSEQREKAVRKDKDCEAARPRSVARMRQAEDLGWEAPASRDEIRDRRLCTHRSTDPAGFQWRGDARSRRQG